MRICAIHQPNFFPWLGYFDKINRADVFVFLDRVHYPKSGNSMGSWCNRVKINISDRASWLFCPVVREHGVQIIDTVRIDHERPWRDDIRNVLELNYRKARNFARAFELIDSLLQFETDSLAEFNIHAVRMLTSHLGLQTDFIRQSDLLQFEETATRRLIRICLAVGADAYLCGGGAATYQRDSEFEAANVKLVYQDFQPVPYGDPKRYLPGLSVIDWLMTA